MSVDFTKHDARVSVAIPFGGGPIKLPWAWRCIHCGAERQGYKTARTATAAAEKHNGGAYNREDA